MSRAPRTRAQDWIERAVPLADTACAQAVFGPLHRHLALIQEAFRTPGARGLDAHRLQVDARGTDVVLRAPAGGEADVARAERILASLIDLYHRRRRVREGDVMAAIAFSDGEAMPRELPQLGGLTLRTPRQLHYVRRCAIRASISSSASARRAPARRFSPSPPPSRR